MSVAATSILVGISILAIIILTSKLKLDAFISLFLVSVFLAFTLLPSKTIVNSIQQGFGNTMASIGFLIILGAIIGISLDRTGGTLSIARFILSKTGEKRSAQALGITGFITGLPIFCNAGFIILSGLSKSLSSKSKLAMPFMATVLGCSLYSVHCLIPPHPGVLAATGLIKVNIGYLIVIGTIFAIPGAIAAYFWSKWITKGKNYLPAGEIDEESGITQENLPSAFLSFLPIVVPLLLISLKSLIFMIDKGGASFISKLFIIPGEPIFALSIGVILAMLLIKDKTISSINSVFSEAITKAGPILIVTAAGGMFGMASFVAPMLSMLGLDSEWGRMLAILSMGAGSMVISHANDSYFWVVANFSEIDPDAALKVCSSSTLVMGMVVFGCIWVTSLLIL